ncbi:MAG: hypothetical protein PHW10_02450 [Candidatus Peribacteraceae bacterium]|nr:hypothetical protein [Candidatus Peribacteraceae bacterium]
MTKSELALDRVHNLYTLQTKLITSLDADLRDPALRKEVKSAMRAFQTLLDQVDWHYMGGIDVLESLRQLPGELHAKMKTSPIESVAKRVARRAAKKASAKKAPKRKASKKLKKAKKMKKTTKRK